MPCCWLDAPDHTHARDATVGKGVESDGSNRRISSQGKDMVRVGLQAHPAQDWSPGVRVSGGRVSLAAIKGDLRGGVVAKGRRVDGQRPGKADQGKGKYEKVVC